MYHPTGHMSVVLMRPDRPTFASDNLMEATPEEVEAAFAGYVSYCGCYEVNEQERFVIHRIELSWFPNLIGDTAPDAAWRRPGPPPRVATLDVTLFCAGGAWTTGCHTVRGPPCRHVSRVVGVLTHVVS